MTLLLKYWGYFQKVEILFSIGICLEIEFTKLQYQNCCKNVSLSYFLSNAFMIIVIFGQFPLKCLVKHRNHPPHRLS